MCNFSERSLLIFYCGSIMKLGSTCISQHCVNPTDILVIAITRSFKGLDWVNTQPDLQLAISVHPLKDTDIIIIYIPIAPLKQLHILTQYNIFIENNNSYDNEGDELLLDVFKNNFLN